MSGRRLIASESARADEIIVDVVSHGGTIAAAMAALAAEGLGLGRSQTAARAARLIPRPPAMGRRRGWKSPANLPAAARPVPVDRALSGPVEPVATGHATALRSALEMAGDGEIVAALDEIHPVRVAALLRALAVWAGDLVVIGDGDEDDDLDDDKDEP